SRQRGVEWRGGRRLGRGDRASTGRCRGWPYCTGSRRRGDSARQARALVNVSLASEAEQDLVEGARFYAREANSELGHAFINESERSAALLRGQPRIGAVWRGPSSLRLMSPLYDLIGSTYAQPRRAEPAIAHALGGALRLVDACAYLDLGCGTG